ncbi:MAG: DsbC family protein [Candidatus Competibacter sp.]|nr:DsbC family protein [Candidatus Competibacter sp.]
MHKPLLIAAVLFSANALAADPAASETPQQPDLSKLQAVLEDDKPDSIAPSSIPGLYEVVIGGQVLYLSADGRFAVQGDILDLSAQTNLTDKRRGELRGKALQAVGENNMIVFGPEGPVKNTITVFTDIDCGYCRKMHSQIAEYNKEGIKIRYLWFPREGVGSESYQKAVSVWCAQDRREAMTKAKRGESIETKTCDNPVQAQYDLGQKLGVRGTPSMILETGEMLPGYVPPTQLAQLLAEQRDRKIPSAARP